MAAELVATAEGVDVYLREEDEPLAAAAWQARLVIAEGAQRQEVPLQAAAGNRLAAPGLHVPAGASVMVALVSKADGQRLFATFPAQ